MVGDGDQQQQQAVSGSSEASEQLRKAIDLLQHDLMKLEMHLVEQIDVRANFFHSIGIECTTKVFSWEMEKKWNCFWSTIIVFSDILYIGDFQGFW